MVMTTSAAGHAVVRQQRRGVVVDGDAALGQHLRDGRVDAVARLTAGAADGDAAPP
jgi:hypothetical protein